MLMQGECCSSPLPLWWRKCPQSCWTLPKVDSPNHLVVCVVDAVIIVNPCRVASEAARELLGVRVRDRGRRRASQTEPKTAVPTMTKRVRLEETPPTSDGQNPVADEDDLGPGFPVMAEDAEIITCEMCGGLGPEWTAPTAAVCTTLCYGTEGGHDARFCCYVKVFYVVVPFTRALHFFRSVRPIIQPGTCGAQGDVCPLRRGAHSAIGGRRGSWHLHSVGSRRCGLCRIVTELPWRL